MNGLRCPNCDLVNLLTAEVCHRCNTSLKELPQTAQVSVPIEETFQARAFASPNQNNIPRDNELGRKTYFWYRVYIGVLTSLYIGVSILGFVLAFASQYEANPSQASELLISGIVYGVLGIPFALAFAIAFFLPRKSWNWIVGIVFICIGMTSCCFLPATVPLLIYWLKPETKAFFGRN